MSELWMSLSQQNKSAGRECKRDNIRKYARFFIYGVLFWLTSTPAAVVFVLSALPVETVASYLWWDGAAGFINESF